MVFRNKSRRIFFSFASRYSVSVEVQCSSNFCIVTTVLLALRFYLRNDVVQSLFVCPRTEGKFGQSGRQLALHMVRNS